MAMAKKVEVQEQKEDVVRTEGERVSKQATRERVPFGAPKSKLAVHVDIPGYHLHWINDEPGRIFKAQQGGYEFVQPEEVGVEGSDGKVKVFGGRLENGEAYFVYLMKIRQDWYEQDRKAIGEVQDQFDEAIKRGALNDNDGSRYVPKGGISIRN